MKTFSHQTLAALSDLLVSLENYSDPDAEIYRGRLNISLFFKFCGLSYDAYCESNDTGQGTRLVIEEFLIEVNQQKEGRDRIVELLENAVRPYYYFEDAAWLDATVGHLNGILSLDGYELQLTNRMVYRLVPVGELLIGAELKSKTERLKLQSVSDELRRALEHVETDPEDAITAACSMVMSVCTTLLQRIGEEVPSTRDINHLSKAIAKRLRLSPEREDITPDVKRVLGGLANVASGIGSLRTRAGDAEGRGEGVRRVDARIARLAVEAAATYCLFLVETWEKTGGKVP